MSLYDPRDSVQLERRRHLLASCGVLCRMRKQLLHANAMFGQSPRSMSLATSSAACDTDVTAAYTEPAGETESEKHTDDSHSLLALGHPA